MCETRRDFKIARSTYKSNSDVPTESPVKRQMKKSSTPRLNGEGPKSANAAEEDGTWTSVDKSKKQPARRGRPPRAEVKA